MTTGSSQRIVKTVMPVLTGLLFAGCSAMPDLDIIPDPPVDLTGRWYLDAAASDDTVTAVRDAIRSKQEKPSQPVLLPNTPDNAAIPLANQDAGQGSLEGLREVLPPDAATWLDLVQSGTTMSLDYGGLKKSHYHFARELQIFDHAGQGQLVAGWSGARFEIDRRYTKAFSTREYFSLLPGGEQLKQTIEIKSRKLKRKVIIVRIYNAKQGRDSLDET